MLFRKRTPQWWRRWQKLYANAEYVEALQALEDIPTGDENAKFAPILRGDTYLGLDQLDEARAQYEKARLDLPETHQVYGRIGELLLRQDKYGEALVFCKRAYSLKQEDESNQYNLAWCHYMLGEIDKAESLFEPLFQSNPNDPKIVHAKAHRCYDRENFSECLSLLRSFKSAAPDEFDLEYLLATTFYGLERYGEAITILCKLREESPDDEAVTTTLHLSYIKLGEYKRALEVAIEWATHEQEKGDSDLMKIEPLRKLGRRGQALEIALALHDEFPKNPWVLLELANLQHGKIPEAEYQALVERIRKLDPEMLENLEPPLT